MTTLGPRLNHSMTRMTGRDPDERHRGATPLELFFDLVFVVAFGAVADELAHYLADGHVVSAVLSFAFMVFAVSWAWINYSWFASAFDTDDWFFRVATMVQMVGVLVLALGTPDVFASIDEGGALDNRVVVAGYVIMRLGMVALWLRAAAQAPQHRRAALTFASTIGLAQVGWVLVAVLSLPLPATVALVLPLYLLELSGPVIANRRTGGIPWHPHHIAERYGLLVIITLGEVVIGTITTISAVVHQQGWTVDAAVLAVAGTALAFGLWWVYFITPSGRVLSVRRERAFVWGYGHILVFAAIVATGAGLHVAAYALEGEAHIDEVGVVLTIAVPVLVLTVADIALYSLLFRRFDLFHVPLVVAAMIVLIASILASAAGVSMTVSLSLIVLAPLIVIVGFETVGHRHQADALDDLAGR
ncbi:low temperature requirement protein A [Lysobacter korlensis]|uniref:Low temperature requirement protein A n=1 Tax=Lysobacter korlensis TaxID=553636 RepID=A0ABV6RZW9_9GAMM